MPFFEDLVKGCFVRIGIGQNEGRSIYRVSLYMLFFMGFFFTFINHFLLSFISIAGCPNPWSCGNSQSVQFRKHQDKQRTKAEVRTCTP